MSPPYYDRLTKVRAYNKSDDFAGCSRFFLRKIKNPVISLGKTEKIGGEAGWFWRLEGGKCEKMSRDAPGAERFLKESRRLQWPDSAASAPLETACLPDGEKRSLNPLELSSRDA